MLTTCHCRHCDGRVEFDPDECGIKGVGRDFGKEVQCPSCGGSTSAFIPPSRVAALPGVPVWLIVALAVVILLEVLVILVAPQFAFLPIGLAIYFVPSMVGRKKRNFTAILLLNIFAGWTFIGWIVALVWAATKDA